MSYQTPVTNRTASSFLNIGDWSRIIENIYHVCLLTEIETGTDINCLSNFLADPSYNTDPINVLSYLNDISLDTEAIRQAVLSYSIPGTTNEIKDDWLAGFTNPAPDYSHFNKIESTLDAIWNYFNGPSYPVCPTLTADLVIADGETKIYIDCVDTDVYSITINGSGKLYII